MQANPLRPPPSRRTGTARLRWPVAVLAAVLGLVAVDATAQKRGGAIVMGLEADVAGFDPLTVGIYNASTVDVATVLFDTLTKLDASGKAVPHLAVSWTDADDYKTWTFKLRPGVKYHDGTPFDANAVKWNFDRQKDPANKCRCAAYITHIRSVEVIDPLTVVYRLNNPAKLFPEQGARLSQNTASHSPAAVAARGADYNRNPVGTGPYRLKSWVAGDRIVVERNPDYWDAGKPYLDQITFRPLPDSPSRFASLMSGEVDVIYHDHFDHENLARARKDKRFVVHEAAGNGAFPVYALNTKAPPLDDLRVRQALSMAIDKNRLARVLSGGSARPATNPYGDASWVKCSDDGVLPHDPAKARALLADYGKPVELKMMVSATPRGRAFGQAMQQLWKQVGANVEIEQVDLGAFIPRALKRQYQIIAWQIVDFPDPDPQTYANLHSASPTALANQANPEIDRMLDRARSSSDQRVRTADYCEIGRMVNQQALWLWTFQNHSYAIAKSRVRGIPHKHGGVTDLSRAWVE